MKMRATAVRFDAAKMYVDLDDGGKLTMELAKSPKLLAASMTERRTFNMDGDVIRWPVLDEEIKLKNIVIQEKRRTAREKVAPATLDFKDPVITLDTELERRMASGDRFTVAQVETIDPAAEVTVRRWRRHGWLTFKRENGSWWHLTETGRAAVDAARKVDPLVAALMKQEAAVGNVSVSEAEMAPEDAPVGALPDQGVVEVARETTDLAPGHDADAGDEVPQDRATQAT